MIREKFKWWTHKNESTDAERRGEVLTAVEEAEALERLRKSRSYKQEDLARIIGKTAASISQTLSLNKLPQAILASAARTPPFPSGS